MNIVPYKGREIDFAKDVMVYRNLNIKTMVIFSIMQDGLVVAHGQNFVIQDAKPVIRNSGRDKFIETGKRNVHAFIRGRLSKTGLLISSVYHGKLRYEPGMFLVEDSLYKGSDYVFFTNTGVNVFNKPTYE